MTVDPCATFMDTARNWIYASIAAITSATVIAHVAFVSAPPYAVAALIIAIGIILGVTLYAIPKIRSNIESYDNCKGS